jgi:hypothetical protein
VRRSWIVEGFQDSNGRNKKSDSIVPATGGAHYCLSESSESANLMIGARDSERASRGYEIPDCLLVCRLSDARLRLVPESTDHSRAPTDNFAVQFVDTSKRTEFCRRGRRLFFHRSWSLSRRNWRLHIEEDSSAPSFSEGGREWRGLAELAGRSSGHSSCDESDSFMVGLLGGNWRRQRTDRDWGASVEIGSARHRDSDSWSQKSRHDVASAAAPISIENTSGIAGRSRGTRCGFETVRSSAKGNCCFNRKGTGRSQTARIVVVMYRNRIRASSYR